MLHNFTHSTFEKLDVYWVTQNSNELVFILLYSFIIGWVVFYLRAKWSIKSSIFLGPWPSLWYSIEYWNGLSHPLLGLFPRTIDHTVLDINRVAYSHWLSSSISSFQLTYLIRSSALTLFIFVSIHLTISI